MADTWQSEDPEDHIYPIKPLFIRGRGPRPRVGSHVELSAKKRTTTKPPNTGRNANSDSSRCMLDRQSVVAGKTHTQPRTYRIGRLCTATPHLSRVAKWSKLEISCWHYIVFILRACVYVAYGYALVTALLTFLYMRCATLRSSRARVKGAELVFVFAALIPLWMYVVLNLSVWTSVLWPSHAGCRMWTI